MKTPYNYTLIPTFPKYFFDMRALSDRQLFTLSLRREPRERASVSRRLQAEPVLLLLAAAAAASASAAGDG